MSLLTQASLVLTPNAYKANKLYSIIPSSGSGDMVTTRATTATRVNSSGVIESVATGIPRLDYTGSVPSILLEPQRTNLILRSQDFSNVIWSKNSTTILSTNNIAPNGTLTATRLGITDTINPTLQQIITGTIGLQYASSFWVRRVSGTSQIFLRCGDVSPVQNINLTSDWQLFSYSAISTTTTVRCSIGFLSPVVGTDIIEIWGSQLEIGAYSTSYIPTTTSTVTRNQDLASVSGVSSLIGQTEGVIFVESATLANDLTQRAISISDGTSDNRLIIFYNLLSNQILIFGAANGTNFASGIFYTVTDETQFAKIAIRYKVNDFTLWVNGTKRGTDLTSQALPLSFNRFAFDSGSGGSNLFGKVKSAQLYNTYLTDAEMASLTTL